jgi:hypothetical protein
MGDYVTDLAEITGIEAPELEHRIAEGGLSLTHEQLAQLNQRRDQRAFDAAIMTGDYTGALSRIGSASVPAALIEIASRTDVTDDELRQLVRAHWDRCDLPGDQLDGILRVFHRIGYVSDAPRRLEGELTIYRGTFGDDPRLGLSWTLSEERARWFAGRLGEKHAAVWRAKVDSSDLLGYFVERDEAEVVADPATLRDVHCLK